MMWNTLYKNVGDVVSVVRKILRAKILVTKFLLARDKFMLELHLRQPGFTKSASGPFY